MVDHVDYQQIIADAVDVFHNGFACSESVIYSLRKNFGWDELSDDAIAMSTGFPWGLGGAGCLCGAVAGGAMCLGYVFGRNAPERKDKCTGIVACCAKTAAEIIVRECGLHASN